MGAIMLWRFCDFLCLLVFFLKHWQGLHQVCTDFNLPVFWLTEPRPQPVYVTSSCDGVRPIRVYMMN